MEGWLAQARASGVPELVGFANGIARDQAAVLAACTSPWSNGQLEGQVNRLKLLKRQMFGRAKFDLLKLRVLHTIHNHTVSARLNSYITTASEPFLRYYFSAKSDNLLPLS